MKPYLLVHLPALALLCACATEPLLPPAPLSALQEEAAQPHLLARTQPETTRPDDDLLPPHRAHPSPARAAPRVAPVAALAAANAEARRRPDPEAFVDAAQIFDYAPGALYEIYAAPGYLSTLLLEPGETIVTIASGDTTRWMVEETISGDVGERRALILMKPLRAGIRTNIVLATDRRTYLIEAIAVQGSAYSAQTRWRYPENETQHHASNAERIAPEDLNFGYRIETVRGRPPRWRPLRVFDDGRRTYVEFSPDITTSEAPPLFLRDGAGVALVNYRVAGNRYVVDRLFDSAELRLGARRQTIVRISRQTPRGAEERR